MDLLNKENKIKSKTLLSLDEFFLKLDEYEERIPLKYLVEFMEELIIDINDVGKYAIFDANRYRRNLFRESANYQALVLCWLPGQRSPIHDHKGSSCGVKVLMGEARETKYDCFNGYLFPNSPVYLEMGRVVGSQDDDIHEVANMQGKDLVTFHVYSPPLLKMNIYSHYNGRLSFNYEEDPIHYLEGEGI